MKKWQRKFRRLTWKDVKEAVLIAATVTLILAGLLGYLIWRTDKGPWARIPCGKGIRCFLYKPGILPAKEVDGEEDKEAKRD